MSDKVSKNFAEEILKQSQSPTWATTLPEENPLRKKSERLGRTFAQMLVFLQASFPDPKVNKLSVLFQKILMTNKIMLALSPEKTDLFFAGVYPHNNDLGDEGMPLVTRGTIVIPMGWGDLVKSNYFKQLGGVVYHASVAVDFYNDRFVIDEPYMAARASLWESQYLHTLLAQNPSYPMDEDQRITVEQTPGALNSANAKKIMYPYKDVEQSS